MLESTGFSRNERLSGFLRFVVEGHLDGKDLELKESVIAIEVFGRRPDFDSRLDPVVRTEAARLRARLSEYYIKEGKADALVIELPKGGYVPLFREVGEERQVTASTPQKTPPWISTRLWVALGLAGLVIGLAAAGGGGFNTEAHRLRLRFCRWRTQAAIPPTTTLPTGLPMS